MSHPNNQHAARLRDMAQQELDMAKTFTPMYSSGLIATCRADAAALLAGAEALERQERDLDAIKAADAALTEAMETISDLRGRLEVAKAALLKVRDHARPTHREDAYEVCYDWCPLCAVTAALARLEGE
ncbi:MAG: hypothetical protein ACK52I_13285 [Pseudomonadota bacterium]